MAHHEDEEKVTYFAETDARNTRTPFGIKAKDRTRHMYVIGKTGMGKSTLLENMAIQDINNGNGLCFIDPHGKTADLLLDYVPERRIKDVLYFAPSDTDFPVSFNVMEDIGAEKRHLVVSGLMSAFKKLFGEESFSDRMQYILQNTILALLEYPGATMLGINRMLTDKVYRNKVVENVTDSSVKTYWTQEFAAYTERFAAEATPAIQNKIGQFTSNPLIRNIIGQPHSTFDLRKMMDDKKIIIINLSKGLVGETNANLLGSMFITKIYLAAMSRADVGSGVNKLPNFYFYVDEFQSFANESFADILSEARKYKLNLTIAHQYIEQMPEEVRSAVFGNVGTMVTFRVGAFDAEVLEKEFAPYFEAQDLVNLGFVQIYLKLMIDGISSQPFSARTLPPIDKPIVSFKKEILANSRLIFAGPRAVVEENIHLWHAPIAPVKKVPAAPSTPTVAAKKPVTESAVVPSAVPPVASEKKPEPVQVKTVSPTPQSVVVPVPKPVIKAPVKPVQPSKFLKPSDVNDAVAKGELTPVSTTPSSHHKKDDAKGPKPENVNALRNALSSVLKDMNAPASKSVPEKTESKPTPSAAPALPVQNYHKKPNEVPEEVLRNILDTDK